MPIPILATKLYIPVPHRTLISRTRLIEQLNAGLHRRLSLVSAAAGFGKTTLVSAWVRGCERSVAWLSLDDSDNDPLRFFTYLVAALQTVAPQVGQNAAGALQSPQIAMEDVLTALLNDLAAITSPLILVLDDYHVIDARSIDQALAFLLEHLPPSMHLVITTREDPLIPLAKLRARGQLTELRVTDLRFTTAEAAAFLNEGMGFHLSEQDIAALDTRTEGWIAGLQLAAISMQGHRDITAFIRSFTGSHRFVLDYLAEEVLMQQPEEVQTFLLYSSILDRLCGPLCDALLGTSRLSGQDMLDYIERANLFIIPLDNERRWYRYHHLFRDLLRQRLQQSAVNTADLHIHASAWYEDNDLDFEAFQHAVIAQDIDRAARLAEGEGMPLIFRGAAEPVLHWLKSLPPAALDARPALWVIYASALLFASQIVGVEAVLQAAEKALEGVPMDEKVRDLIGHIASIRATVAVVEYRIDVIVAQSQRALEYLHPNNLPVRTATIWTLGHAYQIRKERAAARAAFTEAIAISQSIGHHIILLMSTLGLSSVIEADTDLSQAVQAYQQVIALAGDPPMPVAGEAYLGLARIAYEHNDLAAAEQYVVQGRQLVSQITTTDRVAACDLFLAQIKLAQGDLSRAMSLSAQAEHSIEKFHFDRCLPDLIALQIRILLAQGDVDAAAYLAQKHDLPICQAQVSLAKGHPAQALALLEPLYEDFTAKRWEHERLSVRVLQALAHYALSEKSKAVRLITETLTVTESQGFMRLYLDEGPIMAQLLREAAARHVMPEYIEALLAAFAVETNASALPASVQPLIEPLSERELDVLHLIAAGLSNHEIGERLFLALNTVKGHNQKIFAKLQVQRRTEAIVRARELGLIP